MNVFDGTKLVVETTALPTITIDLAETVTGEASPATKFLRPKVQIYRGDVLLYQAAPHGDPAEAPRWGLILALVAALAAAALLLGGRR